MQSQLAENPTREVGCTATSKELLSEMKICVQSRREVSRSRFVVPGLQELLESPRSNTLCLGRSFNGLIEFCNRHFLLHLLYLLDRQAD